MESKNKKDFVFFDLFAMYAKNLVEEKRTKPTAPHGRKMPKY